MPNYLSNRVLGLWVALAGLLASCNYSDVEIKDIERLSIDKFDAAGLDITAQLTVENPNGYPVKVKSGEADFLLNKKHTGTARLKAPIRVAAHSTGSVETKIRIDFDNGSFTLIPAVIQIFKSDNLEVQLKGQIRAKSFLIGQKIDFDYKQP